MTLRPSMSIEPGDVVTESTLAFACRWLPDEAGRVLDIGCGGGRLAAALMRVGLTVRALDSSEDAVERARRRGVDACRVSWPDLAEGETLETYDGIIFSRSLHHITPLDDALERARGCLARHGVVIAEEFDVTGIDSATATWLQDALTRLFDQGRLTLPEDALAARLLETDDALEAWTAGHCASIHPAASMHEAFTRVFAHVSTSPAPYLFRYACPSDDTRPDQAVVQTLLEEEKRLIRDGTIRAVGRRFVASDSPLPRTPTDDF